MTQSNLNSVYRFSVHKNQDGIINIGEIQEVDLKAFGGTYNFDCGKIQAFESEDLEKVFFISRFYDQLFYFRTGVVVTLVDLPKVSFL